MNRKSGVEIEREGGCQEISSETGRWHAAALSFPAKGLTVLTALGGAILLEQRLHLSELLSSSQLDVWFETLGPWAPFAFMVLMALTVVSPLPTLPLDLLAGRLFGPALGTLLAVTGATLGAWVSFYVGRWLGRDLVTRLVSGHIAFCERCSNRLLTKVVLFARLVPLVSFDVVSYGAGLTRMSAWKFGWASFLGMIPLTLVYTTVGPWLSVSTELALLGGFVVVIFYFLLPRWIERYDPLGLRRFFQHE